MPVVATLTDLWEEECKFHVLLRPNLGYIRVTIASKDDEPESDRDLPLNLSAATEQDWQSLYGETTTSTPTNYVDSISGKQIPPSHILLA
jgi:hypothetical protein